MSAPAFHKIDRDAVEAMAPGDAWTTDMTAPVRTKEMEAMNDEIIARTPAGRWGQPDELIGAPVFLASPASDFVTGEVVRVDGGYAIRWSAPRVASQPTGRRPGSSGLVRSGGSLGPEPARETPRQPGSPIESQPGSRTQQPGPPA